jgi:magnesium transporter
MDISYLKAPLKMLYSRRISWLVILVFMNVFSGAGIAHFEQLIESVVALVFFLPLLIDSGGNAGSQAATLVVRGMALREIQLVDYFKVAWRELRVASALGLTMAAAVFPVAWWRSGIPIAIIASLSMVCIVLLGSIVGMSLPFILRKLGQDPAAASAPLVTSIADILGVLIYLGIASVFLGQLGIAG